MSEKKDVANNSSTSSRFQEDYNIVATNSDEEDKVDAIMISNYHDESSNISKPSNLKRIIVNTRPLSKYDKTYKLEEFKKNYLIIFNHENINGFTRRLGTDKDVKALKDTFSKFGFEIAEHKDLNLKEIHEKLKVCE